MLRKHEYFGQYGKIMKIVVNKNNHYNSGPNPTVSAYITFDRNDHAAACVRAIDKSTLDGRVLRASFGTTKYCSRFLLDLPCLNPDCMYLHELGDEAVSYTKQDMLEGKHAADVAVQVGAGKPLRGFGNRELEGNGGMDQIEQITAYVPGGSQPPPQPESSSGPAPSFSDESMFPSAALAREGSGGGGVSPTLNGSWGSGGGGGGGPGMQLQGGHGMAPPQQQSQQQQQQQQQHKSPPGIGGHMGVAQQQQEAMRIQEMLARGGRGGMPPGAGAPGRSGPPPGVGVGASVGVSQRAGPPPGVYDPRYSNQGPQSAAQQAQAQARQQQLHHQQHHQQHHHQHHQHHPQQQQQQQQQQQHQRQQFGGPRVGQFGGVGNSLFNSSQPNPGQELLSQLQSGGGGGTGGASSNGSSSNGGRPQGTSPAGFGAGPTGGQRRGEQPDLSFVDPWAEMTRGLALDVSGDAAAAGGDGGGGGSGGSSGAGGWQPELDAGASSVPTGQTTGRARKSRFAFAQSSDPVNSGPTIASGGDGSGMVGAVGGMGPNGGKGGDEWQERMRMLFPGVNISVGEGQGPADPNGQGNRGRGRGGQQLLQQQRGGFNVPHQGQPQQGSSLLNTFSPFGNEAGGSSSNSSSGGGFPPRNQQQLLLQQQRQRGSLIDPAIVSARGFGGPGGGVDGPGGGGYGAQQQQQGGRLSDGVQQMGLGGDQGRGSVGSGKGLALPGTQTQPPHSWDAQQQQARPRGNTGMPGRAR